MAHPSLPVGNTMQPQKQFDLLQRHLCLQEGNPSTPVHWIIYEQNHKCLSPHVTVYLWGLATFRQSKWVELHVLFLTVTLV